MPIKPNKGESQTDFMGRCMHELSSAGATERPQDQKVAICMSAWRDAHGGSAPKAIRAACGDCGGNGKCKTCGGAGKVKADCPDCKGTGKCANCGGSGEEPKPKSMRPKVKVPDWVEGDVPAWPEPDEDEDDFVDRCISDGGGEDECQRIWDSAEAGDPERAARGIVHKTHTGKLNGTEFVLSDESPDRMGDIIESAGWDLTNFKANPVALFAHRADFVVGRWRDVGVNNNKQLRGHLELAPKGTSGRIDEIRALVDAGILRAVSVGFKPIESSPLNTKDPFGGNRYSRQELVECSLVAIPANANALSVAKSLHISDDTLGIVFAKPRETNVARKRVVVRGKQAETSRLGKDQTMEGLGQRIADVERQIVEAEDELRAIIDKMDDTDVSDEEMEENSKLNARINQLKKKHTMLVDSEKSLMKSLNGGGNGTARSRAVSTVVLTPGSEPEPKVTVPATPNKQKRDVDLVDLIVRAGTVAYTARAWNTSPEATRLKIAEDYPEYGDEDTQGACALVLRAASAPAMTTVTGWAQELARTDYTDLMPVLFPQAVLTRLAAKGLTLSFGSAGRIVIPTRSRTPALAGSFVGEGLAIPVRQGAFTSQTLTPKKLAVISTWTREMSDHSVPAIEGLIREAIVQDTTVAVDTVLIDANAATVIRPAGLLNGVAATTATSGGGIAALVGDIKALVAALMTNTFGNVRVPVWLANPGDMLSASLLTAVNTGIFPFKDEIARGTLNNIPIIDSTTVTAKTLILVDAADFVVVGGGAPRMEISDQATLHMEDTSPAELVASPSTVAAPQRSLFQTDSLALRMVMPLNWTQRRTGTIAWCQNVTWS